MTPVCAGLVHSRAVVSVPGGAAAVYAVRAVAAVVGLWLTLFLCAQRFRELLLSEGTVVRPVSGT